MRGIRAFCIAFSMYSKIPMPQFAWKEEDMKYAMCFLPWVGAVVGLCFYGWAWICRRFSVGSTAYLLIGAAIPIFVTGGIHVDGFMDTMDALHSYQSQERKLEILKDSHIGAFSVIMLLVYYLIVLAGLSEIRDFKSLKILALGFFLSRTLSGISVVSFRPAKKDGMLRIFSDTAAKKVVFPVLLVQLLLCAAGILWLSKRTGLLVLAGAAASFGYYRYRSYREFGGITGDTAGYFVQICEVAVVLAAALGSH